MKNLMLIALLIYLFIAALFISEVAAQSFSKVALNTSIPQEIISILEKSCVNCHSEPGKTIALVKLNFDNWNSYTESKQASKAKLMCKKITSNLMPPKKYRKNNPTSIPTNEEINAICDWANALQ